MDNEEMKFSQEPAENITDAENVQNVENQEKPDLKELLDSVYSNEEPGNVCEPIKEKKPVPFRKIGIVAGIVILIILLILIVKTLLNSGDKSLLFNE